MSSSKQHKAVFIGNIAFGTTEEQLLDIFKEVGPVKSLKLVFDRETGRPKGFGFCEYYDFDTAASAVRNLNKRDIEGRQLKVDFADPELYRTESDVETSAPTPTASAIDQITNTLASLNPHQLFELMSQLKMLISTQPDQARNLLISNPQLAYAILQAQLMMGMIDPAFVQQLVQKSTVQPLKSVHPSIPPPIMATSIPYPPPAFVPPAPPTMTTPSFTIPGIESLPPDQRELLGHILNTTPQQMDALPAEQRQKLHTLKTQLMQLAASSQAR